ncbi:aspartyl/glutamyl-tRNA(Asn/Gln) amidotransferase subunit A [Rubritalea squalenifaciens DSM 18772]|uniref:Glutamyl-tRNA(Gln) amidotransferase subunit A n=1 Tax=Rubritalea squalenifaciens DSM 18772 TaxID=1123071 RepID=A0A1M6PSZ1_9BACT|nr:Asp-tRNA(Asn)/Glu-tRNA(Gln) amidotransferase subunit GatA [Rubritalea squalenifaciens]SHK11028.1 aspartyl/glutamyl-tRNA(Asn/Gln) amidotransferase subunit A [Rubritalea squalenifaciens DSM 18772]
MLATESISSLRAKLTAGEITPLDIIDSIETAVKDKDGDIGGYLSCDFETAREEAKNADLSLPLGGIPIAIKDNINVKGQPLTCASKFLEGAFTSPYDATVIQKLRAAGAIPLGRTNLDEFAMGSTCDNSAIKRTNNPVDLERTPGGSSGGSAAVVAADTAIAALGSDTGGSIRQPASHCGIVGLKPSYGLVSRYGLVAFASSLDQIGPMTKTVEDAALLLNAITGYDKADSTSLDVESTDFTADLDAGVKGLKLGIPAEYFSEATDPQVKALFDAAAAKLEAAGAELVPISLPHTKYVVATYYIIAPAEASSNLSRFDGIRYGNRAENPENLIDLYRKSRAQGFGPEVKRRIILGTYVLSSGYYDAYYTRAQKVRTLIRKDFTDAFEKVDAILSPTAPTAAPKHGENADDPLQEYLADICTLAANLAGIPGISVPAGTVESDSGTKLPVGLQILGPDLGEHTLLKIGKTLETA